MDKWNKLRFIAAAAQSPDVLEGIDESVLDTLVSQIEKAISIEDQLRALAAKRDTLSADIGTLQALKASRE